MPRTPAKFLALGLVSLGLAHAASAATIVSVNVRETDTDPQKIDADESFGVGSVNGVNTTVGNWTNTNSTSALNLVTNTGATSTVDFASVQPSGQATFNAAYDDTPLKAGFDDYTTSANPSITLSDLTATFPNGYFAVVYVGGFNTNTGASISDGTTTYYYKVLSAPVAPVSFVQTTQTSDLGAGANPTAQYAVFGSSSTPLTANSITFTLAALYGGGAGLGGVQLIAVPEPASLALLGVGALFMARRRRVA